MADEMEKSFYTGSLASLKEFWEDKGRTGSFEKGYHIRLEGITSIIGEIREFVDGKVVLDIGCGPGIVASLLPQSTNVIGLDFSISMLKSAKNRIGRLVRGNADRSIGCRTSIPERQKFNNRVEELRKGLFKKYEEVCRLRSRVLDLEISVEEIDSSIHRLIQKIADLIRDHIVVYEKLLEIVWPVADKEKRRQILTITQDFTLRLTTTTAIFDTIVKLYDVDLVGYAYWPYYNISRLSEKIVKMFLEITQQ